MIDEETKQKLLENAKEHILDEDLDKINRLFKKVWKTTEDGVNIITLSPMYHESRCMRFDAETLEFIGIAPYEYIIEYGEEI